MLGPPPADNECDHAVTSLTWRGSTASLGRYLTEQDDVRLPLWIGEHMHSTVECGNSGMPAAYERQQMRVGDLCM